MMAYAKDSRLLVHACDLKYWIRKAAEGNEDVGLIADLSLFQKV